MYLDVSHLQVHYPGRAKPAVSDVSFGLAQGQMGVLIGPSGCGKTSLLRAVAGLERVSHGRIGMVFQDYALFPHLDVARNVGFGLSDWPAAQRQARVQEMLSLVGLEALGRSQAHELSGGQQQRVALARALAPEPKLLLLDEPFSNLDIDLRERLAHELRDILKKAQITALFVTHDQMEAFALGDLIGVMHDGQLHQWDDAYQLYHRPSTRFVAEFIGHHWLLQTPLGELDDVADDLAQCQGVADGDCEVLLRADDIVHDDEAPVKAQIVRKAFRGSEFLYTLRLDSGQHVMAHVPSHHDHHIGEWIGIRLQADHVVVFSKAA
jgi:iron(III) transport system ATP-binding protein